MSKTELLEEFTKLTSEERGELWEALWSIEERALIGEKEPNVSEKDILDAELKDYEEKGEMGSSWSEMRHRLRERA